MAGLDDYTKLLLHCDSDLDGMRSAFTHYKCNDDAATTTVIDSGSGANASYLGNEVNTEDVSVAGKINTAFEFATQYIINDAVVADIASDTTGSISFWVYMNSYDGTVFTFGDLDGAMVLRCYTSATVFVFDLYNTGQQWRTQTSGKNTGEWYHFVLVHNGTRPYIYCNGVEAHSDIVTTDLTQYLGDLSGLDTGRVACDNWNSSGNTNFLDGKIDDFRYFRCALTQAEVDKLYNSGSGTENSMITDASGNNTGVITHNTAQLDTAIKKFGTASLLLDGDSDYCTVPDSADWDICGSNADDWIIDFWVYQASGQSATYITQAEDGNNRWLLYDKAGNGTLEFLFLSGGGAIITCTTAAGAMPYNEFCHIALCKVADEYAIYVNGVQKSYVQDNSTDTLAGDIYIGSNGIGSWFLGGSLDEIRIQHSNIFSVTPVVGLTDSFTPPTKEYSRFMRNQATIVGAGV